MNGLIQFGCMVLFCVAYFGAVFSLCAALATLTALGLSAKQRGVQAPSFFALTLALGYVMYAAANARFSAI